MEDFRNTLIKSMNKLELEPTAGQLEKFEIYCNMLVEWNEKMNLTAIKKPVDIAVKHFADSCSVLKYVDINSNARIIDIGTGAGFPGIPLKIMRDDIEITLLDSLNKRLVFLNAVAENLGVKIKTIHGRAEDFGRKEEYRESFDFAVSRAVAPLNILSEYCIPFVKQGGKFVSMKGPDVQAEVEESKKAVKILGSRFNNIVQFKVEDNGRSIVIIDKIAKTPYTYPRHGSKISKKPLA